MILIDLNVLKYSFLELSNSAPAPNMHQKEKMTKTQITKTQS